MTAASAALQIVPTGFYLGAAVMAIKYFAFDKPKQDAAVARYYEEIRGVYDPRETNRIYRTSRNVEEMGGSDAIHNACASRMFCS